MKLILVLMFCALAASTNVEKTNRLDFESPETQSWVVEQAVNTLIRQLWTFVRRLIENGSENFGIPPLDPLMLPDARLYIPAGLINLDLDLKDVYAVGIGQFQVHTGHLNIAELSFELDISVPTFYASAGHYDLIGNLFTAIPIYGKGSAKFAADGFRFQAKVFLGRSADGHSVLLNRIENAAFQLPSLKSELTGAIGGGDIDAIVNAVIDDVIVDYVNRFQGAIAKLVCSVLPTVLNPALEKLDSWKYLATVPGIPR